MKNLAFIFARGGSKGLPGKNIKKLNSKPLLNYSIETAIACPSIDKVYVSTDDEKIAAVATEAGASVIERPEHLALDDSPEWMAWRHAIEWVYQNEGEFDTFVSLPPTSPLRAVNDVEAAINKVNRTSIDMCISVTEAARSPYFNMVQASTVNCEAVELVCNAGRVFEHRQDVPKVFDITTVVYATSPQFVLEKTGLFDGSVGVVEVPKQRAVDIDDIFDFYYAETLLKQAK